MAGQNLYTVNSEGADVFEGIARVLNKIDRLKGTSDLHQHHGMISESGGSLAIDGNKRNGAPGGFQVRSEHGLLTTGGGGGLENTTFDGGN
jgi:hypothetical protein